MSYERDTFRVVDEGYNGKAVLFRCSCGREVEKSLSEYSINGTTSCGYCGATWQLSVERADW